MPSLQSLRGTIKTKLETLKGTGQPFANVYDFFTTKPSWFPFVCFEPTQLNSQFEDTQYNYRNFVFTIYIVQEITKLERDAALDNLVNAFDQVINLFDEDYTLWGAVQQVDAVEGEFMDIDMEVWPCLAASINLSVRTLYDVT